MVGVTVTTLTAWAEGSVRRSPSWSEVTFAPVMAFRAPTNPLDRSIPLVGVAEALVLAAELGR